MKKFPLYAKILLWFFLNLVLLVVAFGVFFGGQFNFGPNWLLSLGAGERIAALTDVIQSELNSRPQAEWNTVLERFNSAYKVRFFVFGEEGEQVGGETVLLPTTVQERLRRPRPFRAFGGGPPGDRRLGGPGPGAELPRGQGLGPSLQRLGPPEIGEEGQRRRRGFGLRGGPRGLSVIRNDDPRGYWVLSPIGVSGLRPFRRSPATLVILCDSVRAGGLLFDVTPWVAAGLGVILLSALFWLPLVRGITRSLGDVTRASEELAQGRFEVRVSENRRDELGALGQSINHMAGRLEGLVNGQKRFLGDIAHELCSPLAKLRLALGILEQRAGQEQKTYIDSANEKAEHISTLVNELLSFSKASLGASQMDLQPVNVETSADKAMHREHVEGAPITKDISPDLWVMAEPELLLRALSNLLRNAVRYAGDAGLIHLTGRRVGDGVEITVTDAGPGVPEEALPHVFDPFYRLDASRDRTTGGVGLGLSIVKTCVESCQGTVVCRNVKPTGLEVVIRLAMASEVKQED